MFKNRLWVWIFPLAALATVIASISAFPQFDAGNRLIIARYAEQFRVGHGLVFNPGERVLLLPSPAYLLSLGILAAVFPTIPIQGLSSDLFFAALLIGAISLYQIMLRLEQSASSALIGAGLYCLSLPIL